MPSNRKQKTTFFRVNFIISKIITSNLKSYIINHGVRWKPIAYLQKTYCGTVRELRFQCLLDAWGSNDKARFFFQTYQEDANTPKNQYREFQNYEEFSIMHDSNTYWMKEVN